MPDNEQQSPGPWLYSGGTWSRLNHDPVSMERDNSIEDSIKAAGFASWFSTGKLYNNPLTMTVYFRSHPHPEPRYLIDLEGPEYSQFMYAAELPDALSLTQQIGPALQALTITDQFGHANSESLSVLGDLLDKMHGRTQVKNGRPVRR
ncbi:hypothetical protein [Streptomyces lydicus]|uniref:hypothetical protein n=1 Tax=Streptomyces lydicus TaxID=47763 RepID=UPI001011F4B9|nr:hypothetical protein [Streptomyces lydicus]MCZ1012299.1 hypothetical protein [Streptomyces lydicus]